METLLSIGKYLLVIIAVCNVADLFFFERRSYIFVWSVLRLFRIKMFLECLALIIFLVAAVIALFEIDFLRYSWMNFFYGHSGNAAITPVLEGSQSSSRIVRLMVPLFLLFLLYYMPFLANKEEKIFRKGHNEWLPIIRQSVKFGFVHCLFGVPLAGGITLSVLGLFLGYKYKVAFGRSVSLMGYSKAEDEAVMASTAYHVMNNYIVIGFVFFIAILAV